MPRRGQMSDRDAADEYVRKSAKYYNVVLYIPRRESRVHYTSTDLSSAIEFAETAFDDPNFSGVRSGMVYAVNADGRFALVGTTNQFNHTFKPAKVKIY
jgi:hypothetical protein